MKAQVILNVPAQKHLITKALIQKIDFSKRVYIGYGSTNQFLLYHLGINLKRYIAGYFGENLLNVNNDRDEIVILHNKKQIPISEFEITKDDYFIKGANALWYENNKKQAAVAAASSFGGTYGNFYIKAVCKGAKVIIPVSHEKLIPYFNETSQNVDIAMGEKIAMLRFFYGEIYTEIEAFRDLFNLNAKIIASGGIFGNEGSLVFEIEGDRVLEAVEFIKSHSFDIILKKG